MRTPRPGSDGGLEIRTGRVRRDRRGREVGVEWDVDLSRLWDGLSHGATIQTFLVGIEETEQAEDMLRLWDGVALWVAIQACREAGWPWPSWIHDLIPDGE